MIENSSALIQLLLPRTTDHFVPRLSFLIRLRTVYTARCTVHDGSAQTGLSYRVPDSSKYLMCVCVFLLNRVFPEANASVVHRSTAQMMDLSREDIFQCIHTIAAFKVSCSICGTSSRSAIP